MRRALLALATALVPVMLAAPALAQTPTQADVSKPHDPAYKAPRLAIGVPDLQGYWSNATLTPAQRNPKYAERLALTEAEVAELEGNVVTEIKEAQAATPVGASATYEAKSTVTRPEFQAAGGAVGGYNRFWLDPGNHVMRVNGQPRSSFLTTPNGRPPAAKPQPAGATPAPAARPPARGPYASMDYESRGANDRCTASFGRNAPPPMLPNGFYNNNYQIVQSPDAVMIQTEMIHDYRVIRLNAKHRTDGLRPQWGDSIGWYEGDTLVVETTNLPRSAQYAGSWQNLKVTERFTRVAPDRIHYKFTINDPTMWDADWGGEYEFSPLGAPLYEYACHEGNYALPGILAGNKFDVEKAEAEAAAKAAAEAKAAKGKPKPKAN